MLRQATNVSMVVLVILLNGLANALPINGQTTGEISDRFPVLFVPAGYVFSIWGLIYLGLAAFAVYQALPHQRHNPKLRALDAPFIVSCLANIAWLLLWHYEQFPLTVLAMLALLASIMVIYIRLRQDAANPGRLEKWFVWAPFSVYLGWISVATIANITSVLSWAGWDGGGVAPETWAVLMLAAGAALAEIMIRRQGDTAFALVVVWSFFGIAVRQAAVPAVAFAAAVLALSVLGALAVHTVRRVRRPSASA